jgi:hypothetical protein
MMRMRSAARSRRRTTTASRSISWGDRSDTTQFGPIDIGPAAPPAGPIDIDFPTDVMPWQHVAQIRVADGAVGRFTRMHPFGCRRQDGVLRHLTHWGERTPRRLKYAIDSAESSVDGTPCVPSERGFGAMTSTQVTERMMRPPADARAIRRALRIEKAQLLRWRRLVRSRLDLAVAGYAPPDTLGAMSWEILPEAQLSLPPAQDLLAAVHIASAIDEVALMQQLRDIDHLLAEYGAMLDTALEMSTEQLMHHMAWPPRHPEDAAR